MHPRSADFAVDPLITAEDQLDRCLEQASDGQEAEWTARLERATEQVLRAIYFHDQKLLDAGELGPMAVDRVGVEHEALYAWADHILRQSRRALRLLRTGEHLPVRPAALVRVLRTHSETFLDVLKQHQEHETDPLLPMTAPSGDPD